jgi:hypothetical protein
MQSRGKIIESAWYLFSDNVERVYQPLTTLQDFIVVYATKAEGGGDFKENSLEALAAAARLAFRPRQTESQF